MSDPTNRQPEPIMDTASPYTSNAQHIKALMEYKRSLSMLGSKNTTAPPAKWVEIPFRLPAPIRYPEPQTFHQFELLPDELKVISSVPSFSSTGSSSSLTMNAKKLKLESNAEYVRQRKQCRFCDVLAKRCDALHLRSTMDKTGCFFSPRMKMERCMANKDRASVFRPLSSPNLLRNLRSMCISLKDLRIVVVDLDVSADRPWTRCVPRQVQDLTTLDLVPERVQVEIVRHMTQVPKYGSMMGCTEVPKGSDVPGLVKKMIQDRTGYKSEGITLIGVS